MQEVCAPADEVSTSPSTMTSNSVESISAWMFIAMTFSTVAALGLHVSSELPVITLVSCNSARTYLLDQHSKMTNFSPLL